MAILGIDYGSQRVGLAISNDHRFCNRLSTLDSAPDLIDKLVDIYRDERIETVVVGLPRNLDGNETTQTDVVRQFVADLEDRIDTTVVLQDEADTSNVARERLAATGMNQAEVEKQVDAEAAVIILEDYLSEHRT